MCPPVDSSREDGVVDLSLGVEDDDNSQMVSISLRPYHFDILKMIGTGAFGQVLITRCRLNRRLYALKVMEKAHIRKHDHEAYIKAERDILTRMDHPFLVSLYCAFQTSKRLFLVMDLLQGGELFFHLRRKGTILEDDAAFYLAECVLAIAYLHSKGIAHRDLKPENILLGGDGHICITDFGLAKSFKPVKADNTQIQHAITKSSSPPCVPSDASLHFAGGHFTRTLCGTDEYLSPEAVARQDYSYSVDWWALGKSILPAWDDHAVC